MKSYNNSIMNKLKIIFTITSALILIVSFQNCGQNSFQTRLPNSIEKLSENTNNQMDLPSEDFTDDDFADIKDISNIPQTDEDSVSNENTGGSATNVASTATTAGKSYYVAKTGDDNNDCTEARNPATPKKTLRSVLNCESAGDTIWIGNGLYEEDISNLMSAGISTSRRTTIRAISRRKVIIQPRSGANALVIGNRPYVALIGIVIDARNISPGSALKIESNSHSILLDDIETRNAPGQGVLVQSSPKGILRNSRSHHNGSTKYHHGMYLNSGSHDWLIEKNEFEYNAQMGIQLYAQPKRAIFRDNFLHHNCQKTGGGPELFVAHQDHIVEKNRIWVTGSCTGGIVVNLQSPARSKLRNNSVYCSAGKCSAGITVNAQAISTVLQNNIVLGFAKNIINEGIGTILSGNITTGSPTTIWVSPSTGDLRLK